MNYENYEKRLYKIQRLAYMILKKCEFTGIASVDCIIDFTTPEIQGALAYYSPESKDIFVYLKTMDTLNDQKILEVLLHEYIHAFVDKKLSNIDKDIASDDSVIFSAYIKRLNKKLVQLRYDFLINENGNRAYYSTAFFFREVSDIADLRKKMNTSLKETEFITKQIVKEYGTIKVLGGDGFKKVQKKYEIAS